jgi:hypothetical protein
MTIKINKSALNKLLKAYAATIDWLLEDRQEWKLIEEQELFLSGIWN